MFAGHYGVSFAAKRYDPRLSLWLLFVSVQFLDVLWAPLVLLGIEKVRIVPGITAAALMAFASYLVFTGIIYFVEKRPER